MAKEIRDGIKNVKGMSLIAVLWMVAILTVLASEFMYSLQLEVKTSRNWNDQVNAYYAAKGGFETAIANLRVDETGYDSLDEDWAKGFTGELNSSTFETNVIDESSRINVNTIDEATLTNVIQYCMTSIPANQDLAEAELATKAQELASAIIANRPYRTAAEMAKVEGMTPDIMYGYIEDSQNNTSSTNTSSTNSSTNTGENTDTNGEQKIISLADVTTVFSVDKNVSNDGKKRININSADANTIQQGVNPQGQGQQGQQQQVITQQEAQAIVDYRSQSNNQGQGGQSNQGGQTNQSSQSGQANQGATSQQNTYKSITDLLNVPAISQQTLDNIRPNIDIQDQQPQQGGNQGGQQGGQNQQQKVNINSASADQLSSLSDRIDNGIAESIVNYRQNNRFSSVDDLLQVKAVSIQDLKTIADKVTTTDDDVLKGKVNINTIPLEILQRLPGMDETKANAIIAYRETGTDLATGTTTTVQSGNQQQGGPFDNVGQLLDVQGIDENTFRQLVDLITYRTHAFRIESTGKSQDEKIVSSFIAIVDRSGNSVKIKFWKQG
jgi:DNA uptake protein ComE-like DNA-binding protein/Tfp pilus assembly protein PilX